MLAGLSARIDQLDVQVGFEQRDVHRVNLVVREQRVVRAVRAGDVVFLRVSAGPRLVARAHRHDLGILGEPRAVKDLPAMRAVEDAQRVCRSPPPSYARWRRRSRPAAARGR